MISSLSPLVSNGLAPILSHVPFDQPLIAVTIGYAVTCNLAYLARRSHLRNMTMTRLLRIRTQKEEGVSYPLYFTSIFAWQTFVIFLFPLTESIGKIFGYCSFFYSYPKAKGGGYIFEPLSVQDSPANQRAKAQVRVDWHRFNYNIGKVGRDGFRHPPKIQRNLPHIDLPRKGIRHWPWRRRFHTEEYPERKRNEK